MAGTTNLVVRDHYNRHTMYVYVCEGTQTLV